MNGQLYELFIFNTDMSANQVHSLNNSYNWVNPIYTTNVFGTNPAFDFTPSNSILVSNDAEKAACERGEAFKKIPSGSEHMNAVYLEKELKKLMLLKY